MSKHANTFKPRSGAIAAGHPETAAAAAHALREGGNAFDAVVAAHWCACVAEPVLTSLGGGGFLLARAQDSNPVLYDFFAQTPRHKQPADSIDFYPISADFGTARQEFHIGYGAAATPGTVHGLFSIHEALCRLPMQVLMAPAIELARRGVAINALQAYILDVVKPIYQATPEAAAQFGSDRNTEQLVGLGETLYLPQLADTLDALSHEGVRLFYEGEIAAAIAAACRDRGHLDRQDMAAYRTLKRKPLQLDYHGARLFTNPPPASGGVLIGFALKLLEQQLTADNIDDELERIGRLASAMYHTNEARLRHAGSGAAGEQLLDEALLEDYRVRVAGHPPAYRGTTHISVIDEQGNHAALTSSNGEGCGHMLDDTGVMLNNMLGEEDLNPQGFHGWAEDRRLTSMMSPALLSMPDGSSIALGSGGSNRIRSAILQVVLALVDRGSTLEEAIRQPRVHFENDRLNIEAGYAEATCRQLDTQFEHTEHWPDLNLYFGGVHAVRQYSGGFEAFGDPRRGGVDVAV